MPEDRAGPAEEPQARHTVTKGLDSTPHVDGPAPVSSPRGTIYGGSINVGEIGTLNALDTTSSQGSSTEPPPDFDG
jgi:hypothetical protein